jgi:hypothetical protein
MIKLSNIPTAAIVIIAVFLTSSCEKVIEPEELPEQDPRIVVNSIIYSGASITSQLNSSKSILSGKDFKFIDNAEADLYEDDRFLERLQSLKNGSYTSVAQAQVGRKYTLKINASGYPGVEGSAFVPHDLEIKKIEQYDTANSYLSKYSSGSFESLNGALKFRLYINDDINSRNYYRVEVYPYFFDLNGVLLDRNYSLYINVPNQNENVQAANNTVEVSDAVVVNGNEVMLDMAVNINMGGYQIRDIETVEVWIAASQVSEDLYKYKATLNQQAYAGANFFSEPVLVHNNITNGMGIMAAFNFKDQMIVRARVRSY